MAVSQSVGFPPPVWLAYVGLTLTQTHVMVVESHLIFCRDFYLSLVENWFVTFLARVGF